MISAGIGKVVDKLPPWGNVIFLRAHIGRERVLYRSLRLFPFPVARDYQPLKIQTEVLPKRQAAIFRNR
jgi:hypothetical protein